MTYGTLTHSDEDVSLSFSSTDRFSDDSCQSSFDVVFPFCSMLTKMVWRLATRKFLDFLPEDMNNHRRLASESGISWKQNGTVLKDEIHSWDSVPPSELLTFVDEAVIYRCLHCARAGGKFDSSNFESGSSPPPPF
ncbi:hypothetical protein Y032_0110g187 [Ancylostoma ceylanicum]|uniref:Uncharacterized protein n=1 Tax=Ancylostoma ceylanicum TaxID=53326 RepID=A0A016TDX8_9BILA|nr:hypothetical protein Y032_0110g187 [Ancylostoma ceylanicum]